VTGRNADFTAVNVCEEPGFLESRKDMVQMGKGITAKSGDCAALL